MQFLTSLLGESAGAIVTSVLALGVVLVLIVLGVWALKLVTRGATTGIGRARSQRRLSVIEQVQVDPKRQLLIIRRDNVEHVILTGGPQDLLVESGIPVEHPALPTRRQPEPQATAPAPLTKPEIEKLRAFVKPGAGRKSPSLRHTGLLRPVTQGEPAIIPMPPMAGDNAARSKADSATSARGTDSGRTAFGAARNLGDTGEAGR
jgi:flagellar biogenesis protein FliO